jgi:hypothetical protein
MSISIEDYTPKRAKKFGKIFCLKYVTKGGPKAAMEIADKENREDRVVIIHKVAAHGVEAYGIFVRDNRK